MLLKITTILAFIYFLRKKFRKFFLQIDAFSKLSNVDFFLGQNCSYFNGQKSSLGSCEITYKNWAWLVQPFWRLLGTKINWDRITRKVNTEINMPNNNVYIIIFVSGKYGAELALRRKLEKFISLQKLNASKVSSSWIF